MNLTHPIAIRELKLNSVQVRTLDMGSIVGIPEEPDPPITPVADALSDDAQSAADEIVVHAKRARSKEHYRALLLGADQLNRCSSIVFDKDQAEIRLSCL